MTLFIQRFCPGMSLVPPSFGAHDPYSTLNDNWAHVAFLSVRVVVHPLVNSTCVPLSSGPTRSLASPGPSASLVAVCGATTATQAAIIGTALPSPSRSAWVLGTSGVWYQATYLMPKPCGATTPMRKSWSCGSTPHQRRVCIRYTTAPATGGHHMSTRSNMLPVTAPVIGCLPYHTLCRCLSQKQTAGLILDGSVSLCHTVLHNNKKSATITPP